MLKRLKELSGQGFLIRILVKRDFCAAYKQTVLGPTWFIIQPILMTLVYALVFGVIAKLPTDGIPALLYYLPGIICWNAFSTVMNRVSGTFIDNASILGKVYLPRLVMPIATTLSQLIITMIQLALLLIIVLIYALTGAELLTRYSILFLPLLLLLAGILGFGCGLAFAAMTIRYRDFKYFLNFALQLWMYATPIIYSLNSVPAKLRLLLRLNPMTGIVVNFRAALFTTLQADWSALAISIGASIIMLIVGCALFFREEKDFIDTI